MEYEKERRKEINICKLGKVNRFCDWMFACNVLGSREDYKITVK
jgi:hypothetical protein